MASESVSVDLCGVPLEGRNGHIWTCFQDGTPSGEIKQKDTEIKKTLFWGNMHGKVVSNMLNIVKFSLFEIWYLHLTLTVSEDAECKSLSHLSKMAKASGIDSTGIGQGT